METVPPVTSHPTICGGGGGGGGVLRRPVGAPPCTATNGIDAIDSTVAVRLGRTDDARGTSHRTGRPAAQSSGEGRATLHPGPSDTLHSCSAAHSVSRQDIACRTVRQPLHLTSSFRYCSVGGGGVRCAVRPVAWTEWVEGVVGVSAVPTTGRYPTATSQGASPAGTSRKRGRRDDSRSTLYSRCVSPHTQATCAIGRDRSRPLRARCEHALLRSGWASAGRGGRAGLLVSGRGRRRRECRRTTL